MNRKIKQLPFDEAFKLATTGTVVYALSTNINNRPLTIKKLSSILIGDVWEKQNDLIFFIIEEASDENERTEN